MIVAHNHTSFTVGDLERSKDFYMSVLGMKLEREFEVQGPGIETIVGFPGAHLRIAFVSLGSFRLELIEYASPRGARLDLATNNVGAAHIAFTTDDVERTYEDLKAVGVRFKGAPMRSRPDRPCVAYFLDPDGYTLEIVSP
ncbi:MAG: VOC family protein [Bryobacteraceae bacterium]|nr:VOC family protein [Bryobacteraceae bacterium]